MRESIGYLVWAASLAVVAGCASVPQYRFYTLDMRPAAAFHPAVQLEAVRIDVGEALKRPEILIRTSATRIDYYALDRWASGLDEQLAEKLRTEFAAAPIGARRVNVDGTLMAFDQVDTPAGAEVHVKLELSVGALELRKIYSQTEPASAATPTAVVEALSRATEAVARAFEADLAKVVATPGKN